MKIEKLTENKIRVIIGSEELGVNSFNVHNIMTKAIQTQELFSDILKKAEKEVDFCTDGCKLLIEAFSSSEDVLVFTITRFLPDKEVKKKRLIVKRKRFDPISKHAVCQFANLDVFGKFCSSIQSLEKSSSIKLSKSSCLYEWKNSYYLVLKNVNTKCENFSSFFSSLSEFGKLISCSQHFETKLLEHGKVVIKKNAIDVGFKFFV